MKRLQQFMNLVILGLMSSVVIAPAIANAQGAEKYLIEAVRRGEALEYRLNRMVTHGTAMLERKIADEGMTEANARTLKELCRAQETRMRSKRTEKVAKAREKKNNDAGYDFRDDPAWLDAEINRRLDRIFDTGGVGSGDRQTDTGAAAGAGGGLAISAERVGRSA